MNEAVSMPKIEMSAEDVTRQFNATMDSVTLIEQLTNPENKDHGLSGQDLKDTIARNAEHLKIMVAKEYFSAEEKAQIQAGIDKAK